MSKSKRILSALLAFLLILSALPTSVLAAEPTKITKADEFTSGKYIMVVDTGYAMGEITDGNSPWILFHDYANSPSSAPAYEISVTGTSATLKDPNGKFIAPKGGNNNGIKAIEYDWAWEVTSEGKFVFKGVDSDTVTLAQNATANQDYTNKFRAYKNTTVTGSAYYTEFTLYKVEGSTTPPEVTTVAAPMADVAAGEVAKGTQITLSTTTAGAEIYYTLDGTTPTTASTKYDAAAKPVVNEALTLKAIAVLGEKTSEVQTLNYTVKAEVVTPTSPIKDGDKVVIYNPAYNKALSTTKTGNYNVGVEITVADGVVSGYGDTEIFTVIDNKDGSFSFAQGDNNLNINAGYSSLGLGTTDDDWTITALENDLYNVQNVSRENYLEWFAKYSNWSTYKANNVATDDQFQLKFYVVEDTPQTPTPPIKDGDKVVIYNAAANKALSGEYNGFYNKGTDITVADGVVSGYTDKDVWTVKDNGDGTFSFSYGGQNIGMGASYSSMPLGEVNDKWVIEEQANGSYYIVNTGRENNKMEWFASKNYWSAYYKVTEETAKDFELSFYIVEDTPQTPTAPIKDGDKVVIYNPAANKALSGEYDGFYNKGTDITVADGVVSGYTDKDVWTVKDNGDGTFSFSYGGQNIGMGDSFTSMPLGEKNDKWEITSIGNGLYNIENTVREAYMEWFASKDYWSAYYKVTDETAKDFALSFYVVKDTIPDTGDDENDVTGLDVVATPGSGTSVTAGQAVALKAADGAEIYYTIGFGGEIPADPAVDAANKYTDVITIENTPEKGKDITIKAFAYIPADGEAAEQKGEVFTFTYKAPIALGDYKLYFGQLHAHTNISDGAGSITEAYEHAANVYNLDYLAVTDHSNSLDTEGSKFHMGDSEARENSSEWNEGKTAAEAITAKENGTFLGLYGYEMTWSGGSPGHMNTFNSKGFESRNLEPYKKGDDYEVLEAYYNTLNENPETISQFNHPGDTFGDFMDFALYSPVTDKQITLIEVGNGEGPIGGSGYFPSYSYYTRALDKGWHVAPTNNQDNHQGNWGDSNTARSVVLAENLTEEAVYDAMKNYRVYATEDNDLSILYSLNDNAMGSILPDQDKVDITVELSDPTDSEGKTKVEVIVNGGKTLEEKTITGSTGTVEFKDVAASYGYYYIRVTQADKHIAVTAPVWVGETINAGVTSTETDVLLPIKGDTINISSSIYNNTALPMEVTSLTYTFEGEETPIHTADVKAIASEGTVAKSSAAEYSFAYTTTHSGSENINVTMLATIGGEEYTFTDVLKLNVTDPAIATKVLVDGTHYNDYVNGYYAGNISSLEAIGAQQNIQVRVAQPGEKITLDTLKDVSLFVISAPLKYTSKNTGDAVPSVFEDDFVKVVADYTKAGGTVIVTGLADYQDSSSGAPYTTYAQANKLLEAMGATVRMNDDEVVDPVENGGQAYRLYYDDFNTTSEDETVKAVLAGVVESGLTYSAYSGCSVTVNDGEALVYGHETTYSINSKNPSQGHDKPTLSASAAYDENTAVVKKGEVVALATEKVGEGRVFVAGTVFCSNFELTVDGNPGYANTLITKNILELVKKELVISTINEARAGEAGEVFTVIGTVANGTYEEGNAFFDTIYIQDADGNGINVFPVNNNDIKRGNIVKITGSIGGYLGEKQLTVINLEVMEGEEDIVITEVSTKEAADFNTNFGKLVKVEGKVISFTTANGIIESIMVEDESGVAARVFIDGYIEHSDPNADALEEFVKEGAIISAVGFVSHNSEGPRLRVRDRSEITLISSVAEQNQAAAEFVMNMINSIGNVTLNSKEAIEEAREAYESLTDEQKAFVTNFNVLTAAEAKYAELKAEASPNTGDSLAMVIYLAILCVSCVGIIIIADKKKKAY